MHTYRQQFLTISNNAYTSNWCIHNDVTLHKMPIQVTCTVISSTISNNVYTSNLYIYADNTLHEIPIQGTCAYMIIDKLFECDHRRFLQLTLSVTPHTTTLVTPYYKLPTHDYHPHWLTNVRLTTGYRRRQPAANFFLCSNPTNLTA